MKFDLLFDPTGGSAWNDLPSALTFVGLLYASCGVMKAVSWWRCPPDERPPARPFWFSPLFAVESYWRMRPTSRQRVSRLAWRLTWMAAGLAVGYAVAPWLRSRCPRWSWPYLTLPLLPLYGGAITTLLQLASATTGEILPDHHGHPWRSSSVGDFWGRQWNTWLSDWFRQVIFLPLRRRPMTATFLTFLFSGVWHEALIALPVYLWTGVATFGLMTAYFLLQFGGMVVERALPRWARRPFFFLVVGGLSPLFLNQAMLRILLLWH